MLLQPKKTKYKKLKKGKLPRLKFNSNRLKFGIIGIKALESGIINSRQLESARQAINRKLKRKGKLWIKIFPSIPVTTKPTAVRMGKGKGAVNHWISKISAGTILFEICGTNISTANIALKVGCNKLPLKTKIIS